MNKLIIAIQNPMFTFGSMSGDVVREMLPKEFRKLFNDGIPLRFNEQKEIDEGIYATLLQAGTPVDAAVYKATNGVCARMCLTFEVKVSQYFGGETESDLNQVTCMGLS